MAAKKSTSMFSDCACSSERVLSTWKAEKSKRDGETQCDDDMFECIHKEIQTGPSENNYITKTIPRSRPILDAVADMAYISDEDTEVAFENNRAVIRRRDKKHSSSETPSEESKAARNDFAQKLISDGRVTLQRRVNRTVETSGTFAKVVSEIVDIDSTGAAIWIKSGGVSLNSKVCKKPKEEVRKGDVISYLEDPEIWFDSEYKVPEDSIITLFVDRITRAMNTVTPTPPSNNIEDISSHELNKINDFLLKVGPMVDMYLVEGEQTRAFECLEASNPVGSNSTKLWKTLSVDLAKHRVVLQDWSVPKYRAGKIINCHITRSKEREYDVQLSGFTLYRVREEYIRMLFESEDDKRESRMDGKRDILKARLANNTLSRLVEGMRVHARVADRKGEAKYHPGRVTRVHRNNQFDIECENGDKVEKLTGVLLKDILIGIEVDQKVECREPYLPKLQCTGVSWNASGHMLAASYGKKDLNGWCDFPGAVCVWNLMGKGFDPKEPNYVLDHPVSLTKVAFHPENPSLVAAGSFNGEVVLWDLNRSESPVCCSSMSEFSHKEPVSALYWHRVENQGPWRIISLSLDGKMLTWDTSNGFATPYRGALIDVNLNARNEVETKSSKGSFPSRGQSFAIIPRVRNGAYSSKMSIAVGLELGGLLQARLDVVFSGSEITKRLLENRSVEESFASMSRGNVTAFEPHIGPLTSIDASYHEKDVFVTSGHDGNVKIFRSKRNPVLKWDLGSPITSVKFSPFRPKVLACTSEDGFLHVFDLLESESMPTVSLEARSVVTTSRVALLDLAFNHKKRDMIAAAGSNGEVFIWKLSWELSQASARELMQAEEVRVKPSASNEGKEDM